MILDRDGVINEDPGYLWRIEDCRFVAGIFDLTREFAARGFAIVIATNQAGIGRGLFTEAQFQSLMDWISAQFLRHGVVIDRIYHCPDHPTAGIGAYRRASAWRKPAPGMLLQAAADLELDLTRSWCVGDKASDIEAARAAGVGTLVRLDPARPAVVRSGDCWSVPDLGSIVSLLKSLE